MTKRAALVGKTKPKTGHFTQAQLNMLDKVSREARLSQAEILRRLVDALYWSHVKKLIGAQRQKEPA